LVARYQLNPKTVSKWRRRTTTSDAPLGPRRVHSAALSPLQETTVVEFRRRTLLPLDDVLGCLREQLPALSRSALHRCLLRHGSPGISRLPPSLERASKRGRFAETTLGYIHYLHIDASEVRSAEGRLHLFVAIDRVSKFAYVELHPPASASDDADRRCLSAPRGEGIPLRDPHRPDGQRRVAFADAPRYRGGVTAQIRGHAFDRVCRVHGITHKVTRPYHPWTNGQVERMHRTIKDATVRVFHYATHRELKAHITAFVTAYNFAKHLKALRWRTPFQAICDRLA
jgi:hypothetical protein